MTPPTALRSLLACVFHVSIAPLISSGPGISSFADVLILNGPGTCFVLCIAVYLNRVSASHAVETSSRVITSSRLCFKFLGRPSPRLIYVESFARVKSLSLSGKLLRPFVDRCVYLSSVPTSTYRYQISRTMVSDKQRRMPWMVGLREIYPTISPLTVRKGFSLSHVFARPTLLSTLDNSMLIRLQHVHV